MKKILLSIAAVFAAMSANAQGTWYTVEEGMDKDNPTVISEAGMSTVIAINEIKNATVILYDGANAWENKSSYNAEDTFEATNGKTYPKAYIQGGTNGMGALNADEAGNLIAGDYKTAPGLQHSSGVSAHVEFVPEVAGTLYFVAKFGKSKSIWTAKVPQSVIDDEELNYEDMSEYIYTYEGLYIKDDGTYGGVVAAEADTYAALPLEVEPGYVYYIWVSGSKIMLSALDFVTGDAPAADPIYSVCGTINGNWDNDDDLEKDDNGKYITVFENVAAGNYLFKIRQDHAWTINWGSDGKQDGPNCEVEVKVDGSTVYIAFDPATGEIAWEVEAPDTPSGDEVELTLTEGHTLLISDIEAAGGTDDDIIRFYIVNNSGASREGWGIGGFANSDNWTPTVEWTAPAGDSWTYEYTVAEIKETAGDTAGQYHGIGITINIYNDCKVDKVVLVKGGQTGISTAKAVNIATDAIYNLAGQKVDASYKGIVIKGGKKYIQK